ncbi:hypothetical protein PM082_006259 [Marasmius tenuissimus]|nr:hypothetical protein PM082_006259 [Marasmius tenuissimus]
MHSLMPGFTQYHHHWLFYNTDLQHTRYPISVQTSRILVGADSWEQQGWIRPPRNATHIVFRLAKTIPNSPKHQVDVTTTSSSSQHDSDSTVEATLYAPGAGTSENPHAHDQASTITPPPPVLALPEYLRRPTVTPEEKEEEEEEDGNELQRVPTVLIAGLLKKRARRSGGPPTRQLSRVSGS